MSSEKTISSAGLTVRTLRINIFSHKMNVFLVRASDRDKGGLREYNDESDVK